MLLSSTNVQSDSIAGANIRVVIADVLLYSAFSASSGWYGSGSSSESKSDGTSMSSGLGKMSSANMTSTASSCV